MTTSARIPQRMTPPFPLIVVGSPGYLSRHGRPQIIADLGGHACMRLRRSGGAIAPWPFQSGNKNVEVVVSGPLIANDFTTLLGAAVKGVGLAQVPSPIAMAAVKAGKLAVVLEDFAPMAPGVFLYYPSRHQTLPKLKAFIAHVKANTRAMMRASA